MQPPILSLLAEICAAHSDPHGFPPSTGWLPVLGDWRLPVLSPDNRTWERNAVQEPQVVYLPELKLMRMWYRGGGWDTNSGVGVADSIDYGKTWTKYSGNPVWGKC